MRSAALIPPLSETCPCAQGFGEDHGLFFGSLKFKTKNQTKINCCFAGWPGPPLEFYQKFDATGFSVLTARSSLNGGVTLESTNVNI